MSIINLNGWLMYRLIPTTRRLTFDIIAQNPKVTFDGEDDGDYFMFIASNGYQVMSRSRMDIQTERIWLLGAKNDESSIRSGTMIFSSDERRDIAHENFNKALREWAKSCELEEQSRLSDYINPLKPKLSAYRATGHIAADIYTPSLELATEHAKLFGGEVRPLYELGR